MTLPSLAAVMFAVCVQAPARIFVLSSALALCWESVYRFVSKGSGGEYILRWLAYCVPGVMAALQLIENTTYLFYAIVGCTLLTTAGILVQERRISVNARILVFCIGLVGLL
ncbi:hypothetical protein MVEG_06264 [Podila verticillata NRRL 6337]|nr:MAG: hypothetical protein BYD32DRAFT_456818 [Podila humilis]KFH67532.1 hypothetical protein MVEG_06264 [Podila verticillata NRRL 6337]